MQGRLEEVAAVLIEFYEGADHGAKPALNERLGDMRSRANAWRDALWWLGATADLGATPATYYVSYFSASVLEEAVPNLAAALVELEVGVLAFARRDSA